MVVKRQKSDANLQNGKQVAVTNGTAANGALIQAVGSPLPITRPTMRRNKRAEHPTQRRPADPRPAIDTTNQRPASPHNRAYRYNLPPNHSLHHPLTTLPPYRPHRRNLQRALLPHRRPDRLRQHGPQHPPLAHARRQRKLRPTPRPQIRHPLPPLVPRLRLPLLRLRRHDPRILGPGDGDPDTEARGPHGDCERYHCVPARGGGADECVRRWVCGHLGSEGEAGGGFHRDGFPRHGCCGGGEAGNEIFTGGIDCDIKVWDIRKKEIAYRMPGHTDTVTSLAVSPDSQSLLSYSHDGLARTWDVRPFAPVDRAVRTFSGAPVGLERNLVRASWDAKGEKVGVGSGDGSVCVWEGRSGSLNYKLPGHRGTVNDMQFWPGTEPISESNCSTSFFEVAECLTPL